jgi:hypothetical protein
MTASAAVLALVAGSPTGAAGALSPIVLRKALPDVVRIDQLVTVTGRVRTPPRRARVALESARTTAWRVVASANLRRSGAFSLHWRVPQDTATGPLKLRIAVIRQRRLLTSTAPVQLFVGSPKVNCAPPVPPAINIPVGDGWIVGGVYGIGGAFPGVYQCASAQYTVTATNASGDIVARDTVAALHSYTLVVPAGSYTLASGACRGSATVTAGRQTKADTVCDYP